MIGEVCAVAAGGAIGSAARFLTVMATTRLFGAAFPIGTLLVNLIGSLLVGVLLVVLAARPGGQGVWHPALIVGLLGGFTTFSAFSLETLLLLQQDRVGAAAVNAGGSVLCCLAATWLGYRLALAWSAAG